MAKATPAAAPTHVEKFSRWGSDQVGKTTKYRWLKEGRIEVFYVGGIGFIAEPFPAAMARMAAEDATKPRPKRPQHKPGYFSRATAGAVA